jgi:hypothetical protein
MINEKITHKFRNMTDKTRRALKLSAYVLLSTYTTGCSDNPPVKDDYQFGRGSFSIRMQTGTHLYEPLILKDENKDGQIDIIKMPMKSGAPDFVIAVDLWAHPEYLGEIGLMGGLPYSMDYAQIKECTEFAKVYSKLAYSLDSIEYTERR